MLYGCAALLPKSKAVVLVPWNSFQGTQAANEKVVPNKTTVHQLKKEGFDLYSTPNSKILNYVDIAATTQNIKYEDFSSGLALHQSQGWLHRLPDRDECHDNRTFWKLLARYFPLIVP